MYWLFIIKVWWWWWWWWSPWSSLHWKTSFHAPVKLLSVGERILCLLTHQYVFSTVDTRDWYNFVFSVFSRLKVQALLFCLVVLFKTHISTSLFWPSIQTIFSRVVVFSFTSDFISLLYIYYVYIYVSQKENESGSCNHNHI